MLTTLRHYRQTCNRIEEKKGIRTETTIEKSRRVRSDLATTSTSSENRFYIRQNMHCVFLLQFVSIFFAGLVPL